MKRIQRLFASTAILLLLAVTSHAQGFRVIDYTVDIHISEEGYFDVVEKYNLHFDIHKHGIYRNVQLNYELLNSKGEEEDRRIEISNIKVPGHKYEATSGFERRLGGNLSIKIGDPDKTIIGPQYYEISYRVTNAFLYEEEAIHFYWNIKPTDWWAGFKNMTFTIHLPEGMSLDTSDYFLYSGPEGMNIPSQDFDIEYTDGLFTATSKEKVVSNYGEAVTVLIKMPPGSVKEIKPLWPFWSNYGWAIIIGVLVLGFYLLWRVYGQDSRVTTTTSYYPPEGMDPAMAGFLINDREDSSDLISLIPYWGSRGHLKMEEIDKKGWFAKDDTRITKLKDLPADAPDYQTYLFNALFGAGSNKSVLISSLKDSFYTKMIKAKAKLKESAQKYYEPKSRAVRKISGCLLIAITVILVPIMLYFWGVLATIIAFVSGVILSILNIYMIKKNSRGDTVFSELKGFKRFIKTAEQNKLKMLISESPIYFETTMGYALAFGAFDRWAKKFASLNVKPPEWYHSSSAGHYNMHSFSNSFSSTIASTRSTMVSSPSSSGSGGGGGSSGGGFGGGGGGSW